MEPFFKWAGGKRKMVTKYQKLKLIPASAADIVIEPFAGGAAMSLQLMPNRMLLNDMAVPVNTFWFCLQQDPKTLLSACELLRNEIKDLPVEYSFDLCKKRLNSLLTTKELGMEQCFTLVALFLFINKHCFNGVWRVNRGGEFNVPYNKERSFKPWVPNANDLFTLYNRVEAYGWDFVYYLGKLSMKKERAFVFVDPPYYKRYANYTQREFAERHHRVLCDQLNHLSSHHDIAISSIAHRDIIQMYSGWNIHYIPNKTTIQGQGSAKMDELLITNY